MFEVAFIDSTFGMPALAVKRFVILLIHFVTHMPLPVAYSCASRHVGCRQ